MKPSEIAIMKFINSMIDGGSEIESRRNLLNRRIDPAHSSHRRGYSLTFEGVENAINES